jgi:hypothetical protein
MESDDDDVQAPRLDTFQLQLDGADDSKMQIPSTQQPPQSSIIEDLGDPSDEEDDE